MAKKVKLPLIMADGVQVRTLEALKKSFDVEKVIGYFLDGKLQTWLEDRYYEDEAEAVAALSKEDAQLGKKLSEIFGVEYTETEAVDVEEIAWRNERLAKLKQLTDDDEIIKNIDSVAFNQEELADLYEEGVEKIYLGEGDFTIPKSKQDLEYIEFAGARVRGRKAEQTADSGKDTFTGKLELELRERYVFEPSIEDSKTNENGEIYNLEVDSLFIKDTDEMVSDNTENVKQYIIISDNHIVYTTDAGEKRVYLYEKFIGGEKQLINDPDDSDSSEDTRLLYANNEKVVWTNSYYGTRNYHSYYFDSKKTTDFYENMIHDMRVVAIYKDWCWGIHETTHVRKVLSIFNMKDGTNTQIKDDVDYARFSEGKIYFICDYKLLYRADADGQNIEFIAKLGNYSSTYGFRVKNNMLVYETDKTLFALNLESRTIKKLVSYNDYKGYPKVYLKLDTDCVHYWLESNNLCDKDCKMTINYDGSNACEDLNIKFSEKDRITARPFEYLNYKGEIKSTETEE